jgi:hypothetical protein
VGAQPTNANAWNGFVGEILFYNYKLPRAYEQRVQSYLTYKWGINPEILVSSGNPFPLSPPPSFTYFNPYEVGNCVLWLDATDKSTLFQDLQMRIPVQNAGDQVRVWKDKSVSSNHAIATGITQGIFFTDKEKITCDSVYFTGNQEIGMALSNSYFPVGDITYFFVYTHYSPGTFNIFQHGGLSNATTIVKRFTTSSGSLNYQIISGTGTAVQVTITRPNLFTIVSCTYTGASTVQLYDVNTAGAANTASGTYTATYTPTGSAYLATNLKGGIAEVLVFSNGLSTGMRQYVEGYLAWKHNNLWATLSNDHSYKVTPPISPTYTNTWIICGEPTDTGGSFQAPMRISTDNGRVFIPIPTGFTTSAARGAAHNGSMWVAVGDPAGGITSIIYSRDGLNWSNASGSFDIRGVSVAYGNQLWVATGVDTQAGNKLKYSGDGINWSNSGVDYLWSAGDNTDGPTIVKYGGGNWVVGLQSNHSHPLIQSTSGTTDWTVSSLFQDFYNVRGLAYIQATNTWVAVGDSDTGTIENYILFSDDNLASFNPSTYYDQYPLGSVMTIVANNTTFISLWDSNNTNNAWTSTDGRNWTQATNLSLYQPNAIEYNGTQFLAAGKPNYPTSSNETYYSEDNAVTWNRIQLGNYASNTVYAIGYSIPA